MGSGADKVDDGSLDDEGSLALHLNDAAAAMVNDPVAASMMASLS